MKCRNYDSMSQDALNETCEFFQVCGEQDETAKVLNCVCEDGANGYKFSQYDYGAPGLDYNAFVSSQGVDDQTLLNHMQFVKDRKGLGPLGEFTGRTYSPDSNDSYDPIPWIGLRRPEYVEQCNPTQVPDVDLNLYKGNRQFCFKT